MFALRNLNTSSKQKVIELHGFQGLLEKAGGLRIKCPEIRRGVESLRGVTGTNLFLSITLTVLKEKTFMYITDTTKNEEQKVIMKLKLTRQSSFLWFLKFVMNGLQQTTYQ